MYQRIKKQINLLKKELRNMALHVLPVPVVSMNIEHPPSCFYFSKILGQE